MKRLLIAILVIIFVSNIWPQSPNENWIVVSTDKDQTTFINVSGLSIYTGPEIFVWALQELNAPLSMEDVSGEIFKVRTYYHINKSLNRYSIIQIIYYDVESNVLKQYKYEHKYDAPDLKFNNPVVPGSEVYYILKKCLEFI
ncbi:MAG: hypothetical protein CVV24_04730 [Ignavibacteriae bacterium HGW-Ignavibacteriae-3]|nr:MAG: hypothetical protein CVV24_04730 [Ignavibacteriae bacterium HGW-Ignavibacteriae-3]